MENLFEPNNIIDDIKILIQNENIESLILLGDVKSSIKKISKTEWNDIPHFFNEVAKLVEIILARLVFPAPILPSIDILKYNDDIINYTL